MNRSQSSALAVAVLLVSLGGLTPRRLGAQIVPVGPEVEADTATGQFVGCPRIAVGPDRSFEIAWDSSTLPPRAAFGRHFMADGAPSSDAQVQIAPSGGPFDFLIVDRVTSVADGFQVYLRRGHPNPPLPPDSFRQQLGSNGDPVGTPEPPGVQVPDSGGAGRRPLRVLLSGRRETSEDSAGGA